MKTNLILLLLVVFASSCAVSNPLKEFTDYNTSTEQTAQAKAKAETKTAQTVDYQVIYTGKMAMTVAHQDTAAKYVQKIISSNDGRLFKRDGYQFTFKLNPKNLEASMDLISLLGEVKSRTVTSTDVTSQYYDTKIRLENAQNIRDRYLKLLNKASTLNEILTVEKELERINREIDLLSGKMNLMKNLVAQATLELELKKDTKLGVIGHLGNGVFKGVKWLFVTN